MTSDPLADIRKNKVEARQGSTRPQLIYVLAFGLALVIVVFVAAGLFTRH